MNIPAVEVFFTQALNDAKGKFKSEIAHYRESNRARGKNGYYGRPTFQVGLGNNKSYFFELNRIEDPETAPGYKWELGKFKGTKGAEEAIFSEFMKRIDCFQTAPSLIQNETVTSSEMEKAFEINFMKSDNRVVGFVKEIAAEVAEAASRKDKSDMIKVATNYETVDREHMYEKIRQLMEANPEVREDIFFYFYMVEKSRGQFSKAGTKD